jgi:hypothetical protein
MTSLSEQIAARIKVYLEDDLPCAVAHYIAADLGVAPIEVGKTANEIDARISMCQLGLFGYAQKGKPAYRIFKAWEDLPEDLAVAIKAAGSEGRISCLALWEIGKQFGLSRHEMGNAAEGLGLKVKPCQLGCF